MSDTSKLILLGAGASKAANIPTATQMTSEMLSLVSEANVPTKVRHALRIAVSSLQFGRGLRNEELRPEINIEDVFNVLHTLASRHTLEASPLIGEWHPTVEKLDVVTHQPKSDPEFPRFRGGSSFEATRKIENLAREIRRGIEANSFSESEFVRSFEAILGEGRTGFRQERNAPPVAAREVPAMGGIYRQTQQFLIGKLKKLVWIQDERDLSYLAPMVRYAAKHQVPIATLNYDNCIELVSSRLNLTVDTGINHWQQNGAFDFSSKGILPLLKLHGSINWKRSIENPSERRLFQRTVLSSVSNESILDAEHVPAIIFGGRNKLTVEGPFLDLLREFRERLFRSDELISIGYSFADDHINEYIVQWFDSSPNRVITLVNGRSLSESSSHVAKRLATVADARVRNTGQYAEDAIVALFPDSQ